MAVLVKPNGLLGTVYMAAIKPFRFLGVYPALLRAIGRTWQANADERNAGQSRPRGEPVVRRTGTTATEATS